MSRGEVRGPRAEGEAGRRDSHLATQGARQATPYYGEAPLEARRGLWGARLGHPRARRGAIEDQLPPGRAGDHESPEARG